MVFVLMMGGVVLLAGTRMLGTVIQFYLGQRRDLYFYPDHIWWGMARLGGALLLVGGVLVMAALLSDGLNLPQLVLLTLITVGVWWLVCPILMAIFPPRWLARLEQGRSIEDIESIINNGAVMLDSRPDHFRQIIRDQDGWETWLMTVTRNLPMATLESYSRRAELAMQHHLNPVAVRAAEHIIHYRPDHAQGYHLRARAFFADHKYQLAAQDMDRCIQLEPSNAHFYYQRAQIKLMLKENDAALHDIEIALLLEPDSADYQAVRIIADHRLR